MFGFTYINYYSAGAYESTSMFYQKSKFMLRDKIPITDTEFLFVCFLTACFSILIETQNQW